ncbi:MAG: hypothetical protein R3F14_03330 [Polyangiaceae bacterium]
MKVSTFHLSFPKVGETVSGDTAVIRIEDGVTLLAVVDALGHGHLAAPVADRGRAFLEQVPSTATPSP